jgi:hypothetical protein
MTHASRRETTHARLPPTSSPFVDPTTTTVTHLVDYMLFIAYIPNWVVHFKLFMKIVYMDRTKMPVKILL